MTAAEQAQRDREHHQAVGWLVQAIEVDHPGFVAVQAAAAARHGYTDTAAGLAAIVDRLVLHREVVR